LTNNFKKNITIESADKASSKARVEELKKGGVGEDEMIGTLMKEGFWPAAISKALGVSGRIFARYGRGGDFIRKIEEMKRDSRIRFASFL